MAASPQPVDRWRTTKVVTSLRSARPAHQALVDDVLPCAIQQKTSRYHRKMVGAVPVVGLGKTARAVGKKLLTAKLTST